MNNIKFKKIIFLFVILICLSMVSFVNDTGYAKHQEKNTWSANDSGEVCEEIGRFFEGYLIEDFVVDNDFVFMVIGLEGFLIIDLSNKENPVVVYQEMFNGTAEMILIDGNYLYLTVIVYGDYFSESYLLITYEISNPNTPVKYSQIPIDYENFKDMIIDDSYLYLIGSSKFFVIDIMNPDDPVIIFESTDPHANGSSGAIIGDCLLLQSSYGFNVFNITNPSQPEFIDYYIPKLFVSYYLFPYNIYAVDEIAYCSCYWGLAIVNVTDPTNITLINLISNDLETSNSYSQIDCDGDYLFYTEYRTGIKIFDKTNLTDPSLVGFYSDSIYKSKYAIDAAEGFLYSSYDNLHIIDLSNIANPEVVGYIGDKGVAYNVAIKDNFAYLADGYGGLKIFSLSNPENPQLISRYVDAFVYDVQILDNYAYLCCGRELIILDISNKMEPTLEKNISTIESSEVTWHHFEHSFLLDDYLYIAGEEAGIFIFDISIPEDPIFVGYYHGIWRADWVYVANDIAFTSTNFFVYGDMHIIDVSDKANPIKITEYNRSGIGAFYDVKVVGKYLFVAQGRTLRTYNIKNIETPTNVSIINISSSSHLSLCIAGRYLLVSSRSLDIFDMNNPKNPLKITTFIDEDYVGSYFPNHGAYIYDVAVKDNYAFLAYGEHGFMIVRLPVSATGRIGIGLTTSSVIITIVFIISTIFYRKKRKKIN